jgi:hypothetical protein
MVPHVYNSSIWEWRAEARGWRELKASLGYIVRSCHTHKKFDLYLRPYAKYNLKWIRNLSARAESIKLLNEIMTLD